METVLGATPITLSVFFLAVEQLGESTDSVAHWFEDEAE